MRGGEASKNDFPSSSNLTRSIKPQKSTPHTPHKSDVFTFFYLNRSKNKSKLSQRRNRKRPKNLHWENYLFWSVPRGFNKQSGFMKHAYSIRSLRKYLQVPCFQLQKHIFWGAFRLCIFFNLSHISKLLCLQEFVIYFVVDFEFFMITWYETWKILIHSV